MWKQLTHGPVWPDMIWQALILLGLVLTSSWLVRG